MPDLGALWVNALEYWWAVALGVLLLAGLVAVFHYFFLVRLPLWLLTHTIYRLRSHGAENVPGTGPALLVCNHVTYLDALLVLAAQRRKVRFLAWAPFWGVPGLRVLLRLMHVIPINSAGGPRAIIQSLRLATPSGFWIRFIRPACS